MQGMFVLKLAFLQGGGVEFLTNLIVLESKGINVILGMDWLSKHNGLINCAIALQGNNNVQNTGVVAPCYSCG
jgi:hypothetical protein